MDRVIPVSPTSPVAGLKLADDYMRNFSKIFSRKFFAGNFDLGK